MTSTMQRPSDTMKARKLRQLRYHRRLQAGLPPNVPLEKVRAHVLALHDLGMSLTMIAERAGVSKHFPTSVFHGEHKGTVCRTVPSLRVLAADHTPVPAMTECLSIGAVRRLHALQAIGWPTSYLSGRLGLTQSTVAKYSTSARMRYKRWAEIRDLYEELSMTVGPAPKAAGWARKMKWQTPIEWEGYDIDDPRVEAPLVRKLSRDFLQQERAEIREEILRLEGEGWTPPMISRRLQINERQVFRIRSGQR